MPSLTVLRYAVADSHVFELLKDKALPTGLLRGRPKRSYFRDVYFDTSDGVLRRAGFRVKIRMSLDDTRRLTFWTIPSSRSADASHPTIHIESVTTQSDPGEIFNGNLAAARRLRALVNPTHLEPHCEIAVQRQSHSVHRRFLLWPQAALSYDNCTLTRHGTTEDIHELSVQGRFPHGSLLTETIRWVESLPGVTRAPQDCVERVFEETASETGERDLVHVTDAGHKEVVLVAMTGGRVGFLKDDTQLQFPTGLGNGESTCRAMLEKFFGTNEGQLTQIRGTGSHPESQQTGVWLARKLPRDIEKRTGERFEWLPYSSAFDLAGSPVIREPRTLTALSALARSALITGTQDSRSAAATGPRLEPGIVPTASDNATLTALRRPTLSLEALNPEQHAPEQFINADLSWLEFNLRVLALAENPYIPLKARIRFLAIVSTNLDEFFKVKVAGLKAVVASGKMKRTPDGMTPTERLDAILVRIRNMLARQYRSFEHLKATDLKDAGIRIVSWGDLNPHDREELEEYFKYEVFPLLTPEAITISPGHIFPFLQEERIAFAVMFRDSSTSTQHFSQIKLPGGLPRFHSFGKSATFISLEEVILSNITALFATRTVESAHPFRITRYGDLDVDEETAASFDRAIEEAVRKRAFAPVVRLETTPGVPQQIKDRLIEELRFEESNHDNILGDPDIFEEEGVLDLGGLHEIADALGDHLDYPTLHAKNPFATSDTIFDQIRSNDVVVHHPYDSFVGTFERFIVEAAEDASVTGIKLTLYRPGRGGSPIEEALLKACSSGKDVSVFVELKARFDEEKNLAWAKKLKDAGINVVTGLVKFKTHAKIALVIRRGEAGLERFAHIGTGNYNPDTAKVYTDVGLFTMDTTIADDIQFLFNELTGSSGAPQARFQRLLVAPVNLRESFINLIHREKENAQHGKNSWIRAKMNALQDGDIIEALYQASQAGVSIDLIVRGFCTLRPGVPGLSENIRVFSIVGRFLEHARIFEFGNAGDAEFYIGSADWRPRNLDRRVEVVTPVTDPANKAVLDNIITTELNDPMIWELKSDGSYSQDPLPTGIEPITAQERFSRNSD